MRRERTKAPKDVEVTHRIETYRDKKDRIRWRVRHRNGNIVADSAEGDGYARKRNALQPLINFGRSSTAKRARAC